MHEGAEQSIHSNTRACENARHATRRHSCGSARARLSHVLGFRSQSAAQALARLSALAWFGLAGPSPRPRAS
eukprot:10179016-Lingulodinium_polyedra.AAC.1